MDSVTEKTVKQLTLSELLPLTTNGIGATPNDPVPFTFPCGRPSAIAYVDGIFSPDFCASLIEYCSNNMQKSKVGRTMGGVDIRTKVSTDWHIEQISQSEEPRNEEHKFDRQIFPRLWEIINLYKETFPTLCQPDSFQFCMTADTGYQVQKYAKNIGFYNPHTDGSPWVGNASHRTLGVIIYLNTVETGGGTHFPFHQTVIDAVAGRVALFPAYWTHPHEGLMPLSSDKWIVSTFVTATIPSVDGHTGGECSC